MDTGRVSGREYWRHVLLAGGATAVPRWVAAPRPGVATLTGTVEGDLLRRLRALADQHETGLPTVVLAVHARVLAVLSGETGVVAGYAEPDSGRVLPLRLDGGAESWAELLRRAAAAETALRAHDDVAVPDLAAELGIAGPSFETVVHHSPDADPGPDAVLALGIGEEPGRLTLRLAYRTDALDADAAGRIAGYHARALALVAAEPDADPRTACLLSADELRLQLEGLAGPHRDLPPRRAHELFEERAAAHPDAVAAVQGQRRWTYGELDARANRLARALLNRGLGPEDVVAVVTERTLDWLAAVLAVLKAGGTYLPIEPHFPADRIGTTLTRAGCRLVLSEAGSTGSLDRALTGLDDVRSLLIAEAYDEERDDSRVGIAVGPDRLAYIYFTSGSTGEPKGAMCEHAGMLNHLFAKIDDLEIGEGSVVAQTAPQCFDISLWQLLSALLVGGRTLLVEQETVLDVARFVDTLVEGRVSVLQVVPSYLEVVLSYLEEHPRDLPDLRFVSVTGETLKPDLARRWFAARPGVALVNAYGLTETSDDTNHAVMHRLPDHGRVPLGRPVNNVRVYVVDEHLHPVPLGAPGALVFSGVCVGRGYVNDPERTRQAYLSDPHRPGERLYRAGDFGRWLPDGTLEFLGRKDGQVKISGFRIEIGEIDNTLLRVPGVRDASVVVSERPDGSRHLVAFYTGPEVVDEELLRARLAESLPHYMVPSAFSWQFRLPLTANGKIDTKALTALAADVLVGTEYAAPATPAERRVAAAWAAVLGLPPDSIGRQDSFFDRGGTSLSAVRLALALDRQVSLKDIVRCPVLADLAALLDGFATPAVPQPAVQPLLATVSEPD